METLTRRLAENRVVSITVTAWGVKTCAAPFLRGMLHVATGAPALAVRTGAALLPVFTLRQQSGKFLTVVEPPIMARDSAGREHMLQATIESLIGRIEHHTLSWPDQFNWHQDVTGCDRSSERT